MSIYHFGKFLRHQVIHTFFIMVYTVVKIIIGRYIFIHVKQRHIFAAVKFFPYRRIIFLVVIVPVHPSLQLIILVLTFAAKQNNKFRIGFDMLIDKPQIFRRLLWCKSAQKFIFFRNLLQILFFKITICGINFFIDILFPHRLIGKRINILTERKSSTVVFVSIHAEISVSQNTYKNHSILIFINAVRIHLAVAYRQFTNFGCFFVCNRIGIYNL